jgi:hypothetical protein
VSTTVSDVNAGRDPHGAGSGRLWTTAPTVDVDEELAELDVDGYRPLGISLVGCGAERARRTDGHG